MNEKSKELNLYDIETRKVLNIAYWKTIFLHVFKWSGLENVFAPDCTQDEIESVLFENGRGVICQIEKGTDKGLLDVGKLAETSGTYNRHGKPIVWSCMFENGEQIQKLNAANSVLIYNRFDGCNSRAYVKLYTDDLEYCRRSIDINLVWQNMATLVGINNKNILSIKNFVYEREQGILNTYVDTMTADTLKVNNLNVPYIADKLCGLYSFYESFLYRFIGLDFNAVEKQERVNVVESNANAEIDRAHRISMLELRQEAAEKINKIYGCNISVDYNHDIIKNIEASGVLNPSSETENKGSESE